MKSKPFQRALTNRIVAVVIGASAMHGHTPVLAAQQGSILPDSLVQEIPASRLSLQGLRNLRGVETFLIPTAILHLSIDGSMRVSSATLRSTAMVRGSYRVRGLTTPFVAELASLAQIDLRDRFTRLGATVTTYADVANNPLLAGIPRLAVDSSYRAPIIQMNSATTTYVVVAPTDSQLFAGAAYRKHLPFRELARATGAVVVIPELWFNAPQLERGGPGRPGQVTASMSVGSGMDLAQAGLTFITPNGETGSITLMSPLPDVERGVGTLVRLDADSARFGAQSVASLTALSQAGLIGLASARLTGGNLVIENSFDLVIGEGEYSVGVIRGAASFFKAATAAIAQSRR